VKILEVITVWNGSERPFPTTPDPAALGRIVKQIEDDLHKKMCYFDIITNVILIAERWATRRNPPASPKIHPLAREKVQEMDRDIIPPSDIVPLVNFVFQALPPFTSFHHSPNNLTLKVSCIRLIYVHHHSTPYFAT